jgi:hypothetical protein
MTASFGCKLNASVDANAPPVAVAGEDQVLDFDGAPVSVTLDGTASFDSDGEITGFLWRSVDPTLEDPPAASTVTVSLGRGRWGFNLWVSDDQSAVSDPDLVVIAVGVPLEGPINGTPGAGAAADAGSPADFMPDPACEAMNMDTNATCRACTCTPSAMGGCADEVSFCADNPDATFAMLCGALLDCSNENMCSGAACYTGGCMAQIDEASGGDPAGNCDATMPESSACAGASAITACKMANCADACGL